MKSPDKVHGPIVAKALQDFCLDIHKESKASGIRVTCEFLFRNGRGDLKMKSFITPDGQVERMMDVEVAMPRGTKLANEAFSKLRSVVKRVARRK